MFRYEATEDPALGGDRTEALTSLLAVSWHWVGVLRDRLMVGPSLSQLLLDVLKSVMAWIMEENSVTECLTSLMRFYQSLAL